MALSPIWAVAGCCWLSGGARGWELSGCLCPEYKATQRQLEAVGEPGPCVYSHGAQLSLPELVPPGPVGFSSDTDRKRPQALQPAGAKAEAGQGSGQLPRAPYTLALWSCP